MNFQHLEIYVVPEDDSENVQFHSFLFEILILCLKQKMEWNSEKGRYFCVIKKV